MLHIVEWCDYRGLSQADLARKTGLSEGLISQIVNKEANGGPESLEKIAMALGIPLGFLFEMPPKRGGRWVSYWVPQSHLTTVQMMLASLGAKAGPSEKED